MSRSGSTAPARSLVPPRSTPITQRAGTSATIPRSPWPTEKPHLHPLPLAPASCSASARDGACATRLDDLRGGHPRPDGGGARGASSATRFTFWRVLGYIALAAVGWVLISLLLFLISAQVQRRRSPTRPARALKRLGLPAHVAEHDPRARLRRPHQGHARSRARTSIGQPAASDTILLMRVGGGQRRHGSRSRATPSSTSPATAATRSTPRTRSAARRWRSRPSRVPRHRRQPPRRGQLRELPAASSTRSAASPTRAAAWSRSINGGYAQRRLHAAPEGRASTRSTASRRSRSPARARTTATRARTTSPARAASRRSSARSRTRSASPRRSSGSRGSRWAAPKAVRSDMAGPSLLGLVGAELIGGAPNRACSRPSGGDHAARRRGRPQVVGRRREGSGAVAALPEGLTRRAPRGERDAAEDQRQPGDRRGRDRLVEQQRAVEQRDARREVGDERGAARRRSRRSACRRSRTRARSRRRRARARRAARAGPGTAAGAVAIARGQRQHGARR